MNGIYRDLYVSRKEPVIIEIAQGTNAIPIIFGVKDWDVPAAGVATLYVEKPSGALVYDAATISGNYITVDLTTQMTAELGINKCQLMVVNDTKIMYSFVILLRVMENIIDGEAIESTDEFTALEEALAAVSDVVTHSELKGPTIRVTTPSFSSVGSFSVTGLTADHVIAEAVLTNPAAQTSDWTITTSSGAFTITGGISGSTIMTILFVNPTSNITLT